MLSVYFARSFTIVQAQTGTNIMYPLCVTAGCWLFRGSALKSMEIHSEKSVILQVSAIEGNLKVPIRQRK